MSDEQARLIFVAQQLADFRARSASAGLRWPVALEAALLVASGRQAAPGFASSVDSAEDRCMTFSEAAQRLSVSPRTLSRLVANGELSTVSVAGAARVRASDLADYVAALPIRSVA